MIWIFMVGFVFLLLRDDYLQFVKEENNWKNRNKKD